MEQGRLECGLPGARPLDCYDGENPLTLVKGSGVIMLVKRTINDKEYEIVLPDGFKAIEKGRVRRKDQFLNLGDFEKGKIVFSPVEADDLELTAESFGLLIRPH
jgi:hypothetical protein